MQHALSLSPLSLPVMTSQAARLAVALGVVGAVLTHPSARAVMALMVWALVQALMLGLRSDLARIEDDRAAGRRTLAARLGRGRTVRLLRIVNVEALAFALTAVATGVFSPALALLAGGVALMTARAVRAQG
jgi:1,4-dihydroxy-2-naphthoate octaprenyltransferase